MEKWEKIEKLTGKKSNIRAPAILAIKWEKQSLGAGYTEENH